MGNEPAGWVALRHRDMFPDGRKKSHFSLLAARLAIATVLIPYIGVLCQPEDLMRGLQVGSDSMVFKHMLGAPLPPLNWTVRQGNFCLFLKTGEQY